jgi:hypothetical protein
MLPLDAKSLYRTDDRATRVAQTLAADLIGAHALDFDQAPIMSNSCPSTLCAFSNQNSTNYQLPITTWPHQSEAPVGAAPPTRSQLRLQRQT